MTLVYLLTAGSPLAALSASPSLIVIWTGAAFLLDYVSVCKSRGVISEMGKVGTGGVIVFLIGDMILTAAIFVTGATFALTNAWNFEWGAATVVRINSSTLAAAEFDKLTKDSESTPELKSPETIQSISSVAAVSDGSSKAIDLTVNSVFFWRKDSIAPLFGIFFWSTFITSIWVWLYTLGGWFIKAIEYLGLGTRSLRRWLDIENHPMLAIGYMCMMIVTLGFVFVLVF